MPKDTFDFVYARLVLHYLPKKELANALEELHRILKPGGRLFVVVRSSDTSEALSEGATFDPDTGLTTYISSEGIPIARHFHSEDSIQGHLKGAGFKVDQVQSYKEQLCIDFQRTTPSKFVDSLIEVLASKR